MPDEDPLVFLDLPDSCMLRILGLLQPRDLCTLQQCAKRLYTLCNDNHLWATQLSHVYDLRFEVGMGERHTDVNSSHPHYHRRPQTMSSLMGCGDVSLLTSPAAVPTTACCAFEHFLPTVVSTHAAPPTGYAHPPLHITLWSFPVAPRWTTCLPTTSTTRFAQKSATTFTASPCLWYDVPINHAAPRVGRGLPSMQQRTSLAYKQ